MSEDKGRAWRYAGTAGGKKTAPARSEDRGSRRAAPPAKRARPTKQAAIGKLPAAAAVLGNPRRQLPGFGEILIWISAAVVTGGFVSLLALQTWVLGLVAVGLLVIFMWRILH